MESSKFYGRNRSRVPLHATAIAGGDAGESDDENLSDSDDGNVSGSQQALIDKSYFDDDSGEIFV